MITLCADEFARICSEDRLLFLGSYYKYSEPKDFIHDAMLMMQRALSKERCKSLGVPSALQK